MLGIDAIVRALNPQVGRNPSPKPETAAWLRDVVARENAGLAELTGLDIGRYCGRA